MNFMSSVKILILIGSIFLIQISHVELTLKPIKFINGGYESVTISISKNVQEDPNILINLKVS